jgi:hopanoid biosynthesis associated protein HpnK
MTVFFSADDFGLSLEVNEAVERAHREGVLTRASLMVAGAAAADAVRRARAMPGLRVGLHVVAVEGASVLPHARIPDLVDAAGWFGSDQAGRGFRYYFSPRARRQLAAEIAAQYAAFAATGLRLDHANAHKHMHLHPVVGRLLIGIGREHGLTAIRVPAEPPRVMAVLGEKVSAGDRALYAWSFWLRRAALRAGLAVTDHCFGLRWSGAMTAERLLRLAPVLPPGESEIYTHPATAQNALLKRLMPSYQQGRELAALLDARVAAAYFPRPELAG